MIKPAMTSEEWARNFTPSRWIDGEEPCHADCHIKEESRHGMAAICLHEQEFGFVRLSAFSIRVLAKHARETAAKVGTLHGLWDSIFLAEDAANRIEALQPPEAT